MEQMLAKAVLIACLAEPAAPAEYTRAAALDLQSRGCYAEAGDHMSEVYRRAATPDERRAAATFVAGAYSEAFRKAPDQAAAAELLCRGLAIADDFLATPGAVAEHMTTPRAKLVALREPFGACSELLPVAPQVRPPAPPTPVPEPRAVSEAPAQAPPVPRERRPGRGMLWTGAGVTLVGVGTMAVGLGLGLSRAAAAAEGADALTASAPGRGFTADEKLQLHELRGDLSSSMRGLGAGVGVGAALLVTGVVLTAIGVKRRGPQRAALVPWQRGVAVTLRF